MKRKSVLIIIAMLLALQAFSATAVAVEVRDVAAEFICNCGCNQMLNDCQMQCGKDLRATIKDKIDAGMGRDEIIDYMKTNFSEALLAAPEKTGFNLVAWITPFAAVLIGGILVEVAIRRWARRRGDDDDGDDHRAGPTVDKKYGDRINQELKEFGW